MVVMMAKVSALVINTKSDQRLTEQLSTRYYKYTHRNRQQTPTPHGKEKHPNQ